MDTGGQGNPNTYKRKFPAYTLAQLEEFYADRLFLVNADPVSTEAMRVEIEARKSGLSKVYKVPQVSWR